MKLAIAVLFAVALTGCTKQDEASATPVATAAPVKAGAQSSPNVSPRPMFNTNSNPEAIMGSKGGK